MIEKENSKKDLEAIIGNTLRYGVWIAMAISILGLIVFFIQQDASSNSFFTIAKTPEKFSFEALWQGLQNGKAESIMMLGIFVLLITPLLRVVFAFIGYIKEGNKLYTIITALVLLIIGISIFIGARH